MIDYCFEPRISSKKIEFLNSFRRFGNLEINAYIELREGRGTVLSIDTVAEDGSLRKIRKPDLSSYVEHSRALTVEDALKDNDFLVSLGRESLTGLATAYLFEKAGISSFADSGYDTSNEHAILENLNRLRTAFAGRAMGDFWRRISRYFGSHDNPQISKSDIMDIKNYWWSSLILGLITSITDVSPTDEQKEALQSKGLNLVYPLKPMDNIFTGYLSSSTGAATRDKYRVLELKVISYAPSLVGSDISSRLLQINSANLGGENLRTYQRATEVFGIAA